jgi:hypothetical protein
LGFCFPSFSGQIETTYPDGRSQVEYPGGAQKMKYPDGREDSQLPDGTKLWTDGKGHGVMTFPSGIREIYTPICKVGFFLKSLNKVDAYIFLKPI